MPITKKLNRELIERGIPRAVKNQKAVPSLKAFTWSIDPTEYEGAEDTDRGAIDLIIACLHNDSDFPPDDPIDIQCGDEKGREYLG